jgi:hypothetical protein
MLRDTSRQDRICASLLLEIGHDPASGHCVEHLDDSPDVSCKRHGKAVKHQMVELERKHGGTSLFGA